MRRYAIAVNDLLFYIFPLCDRPTELDSLVCEVTLGGFAVALYPTESADFAALCAGKNNEKMKEPDLLLAALSFFFAEVRGIPDTELEIELCGKIYTLHTVKAEWIKIPLNMLKCKLLCSNLQENDEKYDGMICDVKGDGLYRCALVSDVEHFSFEALRRLRVSVTDGIADVALAIDVRQAVQVKSTDLSYPLQTLGAAVVTVMASGEKVRVGSYRFLLNGLSFDAVLDRAQNLLISVRAKYLGALD